MSAPENRTNEEPIEIINESKKKTSAAKDVAVEAENNVMNITEKNTKIEEQPFGANEITDTIEYEAEDSDFMATFQQKSEEQQIESLRLFMLELMRTHTCYELIPESAKVVVFDAKLHIRHAIQALLDHDIKCAPVWDPSLGGFSGMITITDFIQILLETYEDGETTLQARLDAMTVGQWSSFSRKKKR